MTYSDHPIQLSNQLRADQKSKHIIKGIFWTSLKHWQALDINHPSRKPFPLLDLPLDTRFRLWFVEKYFITSNLSLSWHSFESFPCILHWNPGRGVQHLPLHFPSWDCCRKQWGCLLNSFLQTGPKVTGAPHRTFLPALSSPFFAFLWMHSWTFTSFLNRRAQKGTSSRLSLREECVCQGSSETKPLPGPH